MTATLSLRTPADLVAVVPYLFGFHPSDSIVILAQRSRQIVFNVRADLPAGEPDSGGAPVQGDREQLAQQLAMVVARQRPDRAVIVGYGTHDAVAPVATVCREALRAVDVPVPEMLRVADGRYWSLTCGDRRCCPAEGTPYDPTSTAVAASATFYGLVALPDRDQVARRLTPVIGLARVAAQQAAERADVRLAELVDGQQDPGEAMRAAGAAAVDAALNQVRAGQCPDDDAIAWLAVLLAYLPVRDDAWEGVGGDLGQHIALWTDVVRRASTDLRAAPATLLAFAAYRAGEGALASIALEEALAVDPRYTMALLLAQMLESGIPPTEFDRLRRKAEQPRGGSRRGRRPADRPGQARRRSGGPNSGSPRPRGPRR